MHYQSKLIVAATLSLLAISPRPSRGDELAGKGRDILQKNSRAIVTVETVVKTSYSGGGRSSGPREAKHDLTGTVTDPSGLTVVALSSCDPSELLRVMNPSSAYKVESEVTDVKILLDDGTEVPADIVLRDKDLDLAFLRPKTKPASPMAAIDFAKSEPVQPLDQVIALNRLNKAAGRAYSASVERISAVVQKPRSFYIADTTPTATAMGSPAFALDGNIVGLFVLRTVPGAGESQNYNENITGILLPAEDVLKAAKQALEVKPESDKKSAAGDSEKKAETKPEEKAKN